MGGSASKIGKTRLFLRSTSLIPSNQLTGSIELLLSHSLVPTTLTFTLQAREHTRWLELRSIFNPVTKKTEKVLVDVGDTRVNALGKQEVPVSYSNVHFAPGSYMFDFDLQVPAALKSGIKLTGGEAEGSFGYELKVKLTSNLGEHSSLLPLPSPKDTRIPAEIEEDTTMFSQGFGQAVTFKSLFKAAGSTQVYSKVLQNALIDNRPLEVVLDLDNSQNSLPIQSGYLSLVRFSTFKGQKDTFEHTEIVKTKEIEGLPVPPKAFLQHYRTQVDPESALFPTFNGDLISNKYVLKLFLGTSRLAGRMQGIDLSEVVVLSSEVEQSSDTEALLQKEETPKWWSSWLKRGDWVDLGARIALSFAIKLLEELFRGKRK